MGMIINYWLVMAKTGSDVCAPKCQALPLPFITVIFHAKFDNIRVHVESFACFGGNLLSRLFVLFL